MSDRARLSASKDFKGQLLASAKGDRPPAGSRKALLGAAAALAASAKTVSATATVGTTLVRITAWKWIAMGAVGLGTVVAAKAIIVPAVTTSAMKAEASKPIVVTTDGSPARPAPNLAHPLPVVSTPPPPPVPSPSSPVVAMEIATKTTSPSVPPAALKAELPTKNDERAAPLQKVDDPGHPVSPAPSTLEVEIAAVDQAKAALASGDTAEALRQIDAYFAAIPSGSLAAEATAVRIEALVRARRRPEARAELARLRAAHPESPLLENLGTLTKE